MNRKKEIKIKKVVTNIVKQYENESSHLLTLQASTDEHLKPPLPLQGSEKEIFTETFKAFVNVINGIIDAVGETVSATKWILKKLAEFKGEKQHFFHSVCEYYV